MAKEAGDEWATETVRRIGRAVKFARGKRSAAWLSEQTAELGYRISPTVIAKLDSGHRGSVLSVVELLVLAAALNVPPLWLVYPEIPDGPVEVLPGYPESSWAAYRWFCGEGVSPRPTDVDDETWSISTQFNLVGAVRERQKFLMEEPELHHLRITLGFSESDLSKQLAEARAKNARLTETIRQLGGVVDGDDDA